jgi:twitching motility protein PilT
VTPTAAELLSELIRSGASDLHVRAGEPPTLRIDGQLRRFGSPEIDAKDAEALVLSIMTLRQRERFLEGEDVDFAIEPEPGLRFRANAFRFRGRAGVVLRRVLASPIPLDRLGLPDVLATIALRRHGLTIVAGQTGCGKTTTLAAMAEHFNANVAGHILTIEDPIEILIPSRRAVVTQREVSGDVESFAGALRSGMRQDPDVIVVGELRDEESVRAALVAAETGHHVITTLHTTDALSTIFRIIDLFPPDEQKQVRLTLAAVLNAVVCQRLVARANQVGRVVATEIAVNTGLLAEAIAHPAKTDTIRDIVAAGSYHGMHTFHQDLVRLLESGEIPWSEARLAATDAHDLEVEVRRAGLVHITMVS